MKIISVIGLIIFIISSILATACSKEELDIQKAYSYQLTHLPIPEEIVKNETVEIRCTLDKQGDYKDAIFKIRFFQNEGKGWLFLEDKPLETPNDLYPLNKDTFRLYYTANSTENHQFDVYIEDNFGQSEKVSFEFRTQIQTDD
ncbi:TraQ conjugal transfer family protein [Aquimarina agarivorans]|uniref:TraQ conjugal transfer family protein n=1 Tax=Aquimarina agarivorans TaxID=980584 RepID=UPI000248E99F|nr:TraQ conjugal transfer family protein [Aquimarina agarivorans]